MEFARNQTGLPVWLAPEDIASHMGRNIIPTESVRLSTGSILRDVPVRLPTTGSILRDVRCMIESTMLVVIGGGDLQSRSRGATRRMLHLSAVSRRSAYRVGAPEGYGAKWALFLVGMVMVPRCPAHMQQPARLACHPS